MVGGGQGPFKGPEPCASACLYDRVSKHTKPGISSAGTLDVNRGRNGFGTQGGCGGGSRVEICLTFLPRVESLYLVLSPIFACSHHLELFGRGPDQESRVQLAGSYPTPFYFLSLNFPRTVDFSKYL